MARTLGSELFKGLEILIVENQTFEVHELLLFLFPFRPAACSLLCLGVVITPLPKMAGSAGHSEGSRKVCLPAAAGREGKVPVKTDDHSDLPSIFAK